MRTTKKDLLGVTETINHFAERHRASWRIKTEWAYGRPRVYLYHEEKQLGELSPRLSTGPMLDWLYAFLRGLELGVGLD